jgi:cytoskeletal protein RodZ
MFDSLRSRVALTVCCFVLLFQAVLLQDYQQRWQAIKQVAEKKKQQQLQQQQQQQGTTERKKSSSSSSHAHNSTHDETASSVPTSSVPVVTPALRGAPLPRRGPSS